MTKYTVTDEITKEFLDAIAVGNLVKINDAKSMSLGESPRSLHLQKRKIMLRDGLGSFQMRLILRGMEHLWTTADLET